jgi:phage terminase large subunit-like protein
MRLFPSLITEEAQRRFRIQIGKEMVHGLGDTRLIQAVTSAPRTLEGPRATFVLLNETQHWNSSNEGHDMADVIERNATKSPDGGARTVRITNAYEPSEDSVAQRDREMFDKVEAGGAIDTGLLYDSLEAPPKAPLSAEAAPDVVKTIRGDSVWLNPERIVQSILDIRNPPSRSRRWWYNQITSSEDAVFTQQEWDACAAVLPGVPAEGDIITLGFDGSLSDDHTALIGCHVETDHLFEIAVWTPDKQTGEIDRRSVDRKVRECFELYDVVGFYADQRPFESYCDKWAEDFGRRDRATRSGLCVQAQTHQPVAWPIDRRTKLFTDAVGRFYKAIIESAKMATEGQPGDRLTHDGSRMFRLHALNARREINAWGFSLRKENRESSKKIDSMPAAVLARLARQDYLALHKSRQRRQRTGRASF